jgi:hypothetical protein
MVTVSGGSIYLKRKICAIEKIKKIKKTVKLNLRTHRMILFVKVRFSDFDNFFPDGVALHHFTPIVSATTRRT